MEKKAFPHKKLPNIEGDFRPRTFGPSNPYKTAGLSSKSFGVIKFILGLLLLPFVYSATVSFLNEFFLIEESLQNYFWSGVVTLVLIYLFIWEPEVIYTKGQRLLEIIFSFVQPLVRVAPYLLPIYTIILFAIYLVLSLVIKAEWLIANFMFLFGFIIALHLIFSAKSIRTKKGDFLKANYIFGFCFIYIVNVILVAIFLNLIFDQFSFVNFLNRSFQIAKSIFNAIFKQLFL